MVDSLLWLLEVKPEHVNLVHTNCYCCIPTSDVGSSFSMLTHNTSETCPTRLKKLFSMQTDNQMPHTYGGIVQYCDKSCCQNNIGNICTARTLAAKT